MSRGGAVWYGRLAVWTAQGVDGGGLMLRKTYVYFAVLASTPPEGRNMLAIRLSAEMENNLSELSLQTGKSKSFHVREAIARYLDGIQAKKDTAGGAYDIHNPKFRAQLRRECRSLNTTQDEQEATEMCERATLDSLDDDWTW